MKDEILRGAPQNLKHLQKRVRESVKLLVFQRDYCKRLANYGRTTRRLPPYYPDLNQIENYGHLVKIMLHKQIEF